MNRDILCLVLFSLILVWILKIVADSKKDESATKATREGKLYIDTEDFWNLDTIKKQIKEYGTGNNRKNRKR